MKRFRINFIFISLLFLLTRCSDLYSTSLWFFQEGGSADETNPLVAWFGLGWTALIIANAIVFVLVVTAFYYSTFIYKPRQLDEKPKNLLDYLSRSYFGMPGKFYWIFYKLPGDWKMYWGHFGYAIIRALIVAGILATIHNLCQYYQVEVYGRFRELVGRPRYVIFGLIAISVVLSYRAIVKREYSKIKSTER